MIKIIDKFIGSKDEPGYHHCTTLEEFNYVIVSCSVNAEEYEQRVLDHLREHNFIGADESPNIYYGQCDIHSRVQTFDEETQTLTRETVFVSEEERIKVGELRQSVDWSSLFPGEMFTHIVDYVEVVN